MKLTDFKRYKANTKVKGNSTKSIPIEAAPKSTSLISKARMKNRMTLL